ncbi:MAG TPA: hypothetical protein PLP83_01320 [Candidatus Aminicenantes bacterium]|nr:hypothetical protein [Candidatus Aminicenantes bacterium]
MPDTALLALTWRITRRRVLASWPAVAAALAFPAGIAWIGIGHSYGTAAKLFYFLLPHAFLLAAQDAARTDLESGALENMLFAAGRFRGFLRAKALVAAAWAGGYALALFGLFAAWGLALGEFRPADLVKFGLAVLAGLYYAGLAAALGHWMRGGANVLALLLAQAAATLALVFTAGARTGFLDHVATGRFPGLGPKLLFAGLAALLPNVVVAGRLSVFTAEVLAGLVLVWAAEERLVRALELRKGTRP